MQNITNNPYRVIGILANSSAKEIQSRKSKITAYSKVGKEITSEYDFAFLNPIERDQLSIEKAFSAIQQSKEILDNSLFWFISTNSFDETAISYLVKGDKIKAVEIWEKVTFQKEITSKNFSCLNNLGTLKLLGESESELKVGIEIKLKLIESECFTEFVHSVAGEAFVIDTKNQLESFINDFLKQIQGKYTNSDIIKLFSNCSENTQKYLSQKFTEEPLHNIESAIENTKKKRTQNKKDGFKLGLKLSNDTKSDLKHLVALLGLNDLKYKLIADNLAKELMQCGIDYFNESQDNDSTEDYLENAMQLNVLANTIAVGKLAKDKAIDNISTLEKMRDRIILEAIEILKNIKETFEKNEKDILNEVNKMSLYSIDWYKVWDVVEDSIDWKKVKKLLDTILSIENLKKIKYSSDDKLKAEFLELAKWIDLNTPADSITDKYKKISPPDRPFIVISSEITNTDNKPLYTKYVRHIGLKLNIDVKIEKSINLYIKYVNPDLSLLGGNRKSQTLMHKYPKIGYRGLKAITNNYSRELTFNLSQDTKSIKITGWGNEDKCIFSSGTNHIEIFDVDGYLIHKEAFEIDLAPSEKFEMELKKAEERLKVIKNFQYFKSELDTLNSQMSNIKQWQFLRSQSDREMQINEKQKQIDLLVKKADKEKASETSKQQTIITEIKSKIQKAEY